jgi:hypothetical protein
MKQLFWQYRGDVQEDFRALGGRDFAQEALQASNVTNMLTTSNPGPMFADEQGTRIVIMAAIREG